MAIGTLTPKIRVCFSESCSKIKVYDTTGVESTANPGGWGATNILPPDIDNAKLTYTTPSGSDTSYYIQSNINAQTTVSGEFLIAEIDITAEDGYYSFVYYLEDSGVLVEKRLHTYSLCVVRCCVDKLWAQVAANALSEDCKCTGEKTTALEKAEIAEGLYNAIRFGAACNSSSVKDTLLGKLQRICKLENCNCK